MANFFVRRAPLALAAAACALALSTAAFAQAEWRLASVYPADSFHVRNLQQFADEVAGATGGKVKFTVHANATLFKSAEIFPAVRAGKVEGGEVIMSALAKEIPLFAIDTLPFIVSGYDDARAMWEASRAPSAQALDKRGMQLLYTVPWQPQNLYSVKKIDVPADFAGQRLRHYSPTTERIAELLGAKPVIIPVQMTELARAIAGDQLDLMLTSSWTGVETKSWSRMKHYYKVNAWIPKNVVFMNKAAFDKLDAGGRKAVMDAARAAELRGWKASQSMDESLEAQLVANGVSVSRLNPTVLRYFDRVGEQLAREWLKQAPPDDMRVLIGYIVKRSAR